MEANTTPANATFLFPFPARGTMLAVQSEVPVNLGYPTGLARSRIALPLLALFATLGTTADAAQSSPAVHDTVTSADGVRIVYETRGKGEPALVFVHGWSCNRTFWAGQLEPFAKQYQVVALDLGGHGESGLGRKDWSMASFGEDVASVVKKLNLQHVILIGHSMGGDVIPEAARRLPGRVVGLIWLDTYKKLGPGRSPEEVEAFVAKFRADFPDTTRNFVRGMFAENADPALVERVANTMSSANPAVALSALDHAFGYSRQMPHTLEELKLPVIAINPDNAPTDAASMEKYGVRAMYMTGVGHFEMMEDPARFNEILKQAIASLAAPGPPKR